ncbi:MAG: hypothetical protein CL678_18340 [Bdellovibrionaceae bacterium]|nr:hypothetical protein [Pseudobdellovibrionaceae bacterium]|tara:strand:+ start:197 stop:1285 length:1089 start_codon:yes stop_codon:yes gene_type:complete
MKFFTSTSIRRSFLFILWVIVFFIGIQGRADDSLSKFKQVEKQLNDIQKVIDAPKGTNAPTVFPYLPQLELEAWIQKARQSAIRMGSILANSTVRSEHKEFAKNRLDYLQILLTMTQLNLRELESLIQKKNEIQKSLNERHLNLRHNSARIYERISKATLDDYIKVFNQELRRMIASADRIFSLFFEHGGEILVRQDQKLLNLSEQLLLETQRLAALHGYPQPKTIQTAIAKLAKFNHKQMISKWTGFLDDLNASIFEFPERNKVKNENEIKFRLLMIASQAVLMDIEALQSAQHTHRKYSPDRVMNEWLKRVFREEFMRAFRDISAQEKLALISDQVGTLLKTANGYELMGCPNLFITADQ